MKIVKSLDEYFGIIKQNKKVLVDFFANWCGPCKMLAPVLEELSEISDIEIIKVDVDQTPEVARLYAIMSIPTLLLFNNGEIVNSTMGYKDLDALKEFIK